MDLPNVEAFTAWKATATSSELAHRVAADALDALIDDEPYWQALEAVLGPDAVAAITIQIEQMADSHRDEFPDWMLYGMHDNSPNSAADRMVFTQEVKP